MNSKERVLAALKHQEADQVPVDLCGTTVSGIAKKAYESLLKYEGKRNNQINLVDIIQQLAQPDEAFLEEWGVDSRGLIPGYYATFPLPVKNEYWRQTHSDFQGGLKYHDEWGLDYFFRPETDFYYSQLDSLNNDTELTSGTVENIVFPSGDEPSRFFGLKEMAKEYRRKNKAILLKSANSGLQETSTKIRGMANFFMDMSLNRVSVEALLDRIVEFKIEYWRAALNKLEGLVDIVVEADDYGTQESLLFSSDMFRELYKPRWKNIFDEIKSSAPHVKIFFHSCGAVRPLIPDFIEMGVDILNPIHIKAQGMDPKQLKQDFGRDVVFWGGGIDTQEILPYGTPQEVKDDVKRNIDILAPGGGWIFAPVHNIQADVPPENLTALKEALKEYKIY